MVPVVAALAAAHDLGVVHRDLKPDNIFLSAERSSISPKVLDFGISKVADSRTASSLTDTGTLLGTPYYMSPEQAQTEKNIDAKSDQYSLGVILYECVAGRRPIEEPALYRLMQRIVQGDFPPPRQLNPNIPGAFEQVILGAMARAPADRFPTTRALGRALLPFASERVRANYAEELAQDEQQSVRKPTDIVTNRAGGLDTTLGHSTHESESSRPALRRGGLLVATVALLSVLVGTMVWKFLPSAAPTAPGGSADAPAAAQPAPAESAPPTRAPEAPLADRPAKTLPAANLPAAASTPPATSATMPSSEPSKPNKSAPVSKPSPKRAAPVSDRPELAPR
jgi:serine/threonine-protein kinase